MRRDMELLWQTEELRTVRPTVLDEARDIRFHLDLLMDVIPAVHAELDRRWIEVFGGPPPPFHPFLRLGSWVGGDQDGNPHARSKTLRDALRAQKQMVLARYRDSAHAISVQYSQSTRWTGADPVLAASIADDEALMPEAAHDLGERNRSEPYRRKLTLIHHRLEASLAQLQGVRAAERPTPTPRSSSTTSTSSTPPSAGSAAPSSLTAGCWSCGARSAPSTSTAMRSTSGCTPRGCARSPRESCVSAASWTAPWTPSTRTPPSACSRAPCSSAGPTSAP